MRFFYFLLLVNDHIHGQATYQRLFEHFTMLIAAWHPQIFRTTSHTDPSPTGPEPWVYRYTVTEAIGAPSQTDF